MPHNSRINDLLEEILNSDDSPEDICATSPELLSEVLNRLRKVRALEDRIDRIFPSTEDGMRSTFAREVDTRNDPPIIPGYEVESVLGRGGMGVVYRAKQINLNRFVALKMLLAGSHASQTELLRFSREAKAIAGLRHPNIVQIYDVGDVGGQPYYTMHCNWTRTTLGPTTI